MVCACSSAGANWGTRATWGPEIEGFLAMRAAEWPVSAATRNRALRALPFLYRE